MNCEKIKAQLSAYIDGEASKRHSVLIRKHLAACADCRYEEQSLREASRLLKNWEDVRTPDGFCEAVLAKAENVSRSPQRSIIINAVRPLAGPRSLIKVTAYGMAVLLLCVGVIFFARPPLKRATTVEPHPPRIESASYEINDVTETFENSPKYTTMARMKVAQIWE